MLEGTNNKMQTSIVKREPTIKYIVEYRTNEFGQKVKVTKKVQVTKVSKLVSARVMERRRNWKKFGKYANSDDRGVTMLGDPITLLLGDDVKKQERRDQIKKDKEQIDTMLQAMLQGKDPNEKAVWKSQKKTELSQTLSSTAQSMVPTPGTYVPPHKKKAMASGTATAITEPFRSYDNSNTIRVSHLSEETNEQDLEQIFKRFGRILRINLVRSKIDGRSREFAFITFSTKQAGQDAIDTMHRQSWDNMIINVEWPPEK